MMTICIQSVLLPKRYATDRSCCDSVLLMTFAAQMCNTIKEAMAMKGREIDTSFLPVSWLGHDPSKPLREAVPLPPDTDEE